MTTYPLSEILLQTGILPSQVVEAALTFRKPVSTRETFGNQALISALPRALESAMEPREMSFDAYEVVEGVLRVETQEDVLFEGEVMVAVEPDGTMVFPWTEDMEHHSAPEVFLSHLTNCLSTFDNSMAFSEGVLRHHDDRVIGLAVIPCSMNNS